MTRGADGDETIERHATDSPPAPAAAPTTVSVTVSPPARRRRSAQAGRFRLALAAIVVIGAASLAAALLLTSSGGGGGSTGGGSWSDWQPGSQGLAGAQQIADYLSPYYRASSAYQLAVVTAVDLKSGANPLQVVIPSSGSGGGYQALDPSSTVAYNLCGIGSQDCSIGVGVPSSDRLLLLRREALELALYSLKYLSGVDTVVALLPPGRMATPTRSATSAKAGKAGQAATTTTTQSVDLAVAFDREELAPFLSRPLRETLPEPVPPTVTEIATAPESELVSIVTAHGLFTEHTEQAQDGSNLLVLSPLPPQ